MLEKGKDRIRAAEKTDKGFTSITGAKTRLGTQPLWILSTLLICQLWENAIIVDVVAKGGLLLEGACMCRGGIRCALKRQKE